VGLTLRQLKLELDQLTARIDQMDRVIQQTAKENGSSSSTLYQNRCFDSLQARSGEASGFQGLRSHPQPFGTRRSFRLPHSENPT
jgi:hypothetical protein